METKIFKPWWRPLKARSLTNYNRSLILKGMQAFYTNLLVIINRWIDWMIEQFIDGGNRLIGWLIALFIFSLIVFYHDTYTHAVISSCSKSADKPSTSCVRTLVPSCQQVWNKLLTTCNNLVDIIRLVARLFQQVWYSHDIAILLQPCNILIMSWLYQIC
jgi:hypothetical protein